MQPNTLSNELPSTYCPLGRNKGVRITAHAVERFIERVAPHLEYMSGFTRLCAEVAQAVPRCPAGEVRPSRASHDALTRFGYTPSCVCIIRVDTNTIVTVIPYGSKIVQRPREGRQHIKGRDARRLRIAATNRGLRILDSLTVTD